MDENDFVNCPKCGEIIPQKDNFCKHCGQRSKCEECGENSMVIESDYGGTRNRCSRCGHKSEFTDL